jgi:hypothetical protein
MRACGSFKNLVFKEGLCFAPEPLEKWIYYLFRWEGLKEQLAYVWGRGDN